MSFVVRYFSWLFEDATKSQPLSRQKITRLLSDKSIAERKKLATSKKTNPEILDVLASDRDASVRRAIALNPKTPLRASVQLAKDESDDVRLQLAKRLTKILPGLSIEQHSEVYALTVQSLGMLAEDQVTNVRVALSASLKDVAKTPPSIARKLAEDVEREVAEPILRFSLSLSDDDLINIIKKQPNGWKVISIAQRKNVSEDVSHTIIQSENDAANEALLKNDGAKISDADLEEIIAQAHQNPELKKALVDREKLPRQIGRQLNQIVDGFVETFLRQSNDVDEAMVHDIATAVRRRIDFNEEIMKPEEGPDQWVKRLIKEGALDEQAIMDAMAWGERLFVIHAIAAMAKIPVEIAQKMIDMGTAKPVVALCWKAKISMRLCLQIQQKIARVPHTRMLLAKGGEHYPLAEEDIQWQLEFFGVE